MRMRSQPFGPGMPLTAAAIVVTIGLALLLAVSVLGRVPLVTPDVPRLVPSVDTQSSPNPGGGTVPSTTAGPANDPAASAAPAGNAPLSTPAPQTAPSGPAPDRPQKIYGDMPIDPPLPNPDPIPAPK